MGFRHGFAYAWKGPRIFGAIYCGLGAGMLAEALMPARPAQTVLLEVLRPGQDRPAVEETRRAA
jgi:hypothetical protein